MNMKMYVCCCSERVQLQQQKFCLHISGCETYQKRSKYIASFSQQHIQIARIPYLLGMINELEILYDLMNELEQQNQQGLTQEYYSEGYQEQHLRDDPFFCLCGTSVKPTQKQMKYHIANCEFYKKSGPFFQIYFAQQPCLLQHIREAYQFEFLFLISKISYIITKQSEGKPPQQEAKPPQYEGLTLSQIMKKQKDCQLCKKTFPLEKMVQHEQCQNQACKVCLKNSIDIQIQKNIQQIQCPFCQQQYTESFLKRILKADELKQLLQRIQEDLEIKYNAVQCINKKCNWKGEVDEGNPATQLRHPVTKEPLKKEYIDHYRKNKFQCVCGTDQCKKCKATPYHLGYTCEEFSDKKKKRCCRFCHEYLENPQGNVCDKEDCVQSSKIACQKLLPCGHICSGVEKESQCPPCLHEDCKKEGRPDGNDYCTICQTESLNSAPVVQSSCGHIYHFMCMKRQLETKWNGPRIVFPFCECPQCKKWLRFDKNSILQRTLENYQELQYRISIRALERLKNDGLDKNDKMPKEFQNQPQAYALAIYCYYLCYKCKKPYFGGVKDCQRAMEEEEQEFNEKELICSNCCDIPLEGKCRIHGNEYIEYKCKFCCSVAVWFCWGTTHFCEPCHHRQCNKDYVTKLSKDKLPKCPGKELCPLKVDHKPNGEEQALGCGIQLIPKLALCRNERDNRRY